MKHPIQALSESEVVRNFPKRGRTAGWYFRTDEVSAGVYKVEGADLWGRMVSRTGTNPDELLAACEQDAEGIRMPVEKAR